MIDRRLRAVAIECVLEFGADRCGEATRLCDGDVARVGARAGNDVARQLCAGSGHTNGFETLEQHIERHDLGNRSGMAKLIGIHCA